MGHIRRELAGVTLLFGAAFVAGALVSGGALPAQHCWAATTAFGPVGACTRSFLFRTVGPFGAAFVPLFMALYALQILGRLAISGRFATSGNTVRAAATRGTTVNFRDLQQPRVEERVHALPPHELLSLGAEPVAPDAKQLDVIGYRLTGALRALMIDGDIIGRRSGPAVTRFELALAPGAKLRSIVDAGPELAAGTKAGAMRIVAPIPGRGTVGIELPNPAVDSIPATLRRLIDDPDFANPARGLPVALGRDVDGAPVISDLARMPHLLIAGAPESGKSALLDSVISSLVYRHAPDTLKFLMVDSASSGLGKWSGLTHLRHPVVTGEQESMAVIEWAALEMERRNETVAKAGARNIRDLRQKVSGEVMPYIVLLVNEIADLMVSEEGVEAPLAMLAQKGRTAGIHVVLATARPHANVVSALIKANFPSRIALRLPSALDSRRVLDSVGAESLIGNGDMLFAAPGKTDLVRVQGAWVPEADRARLVGWLAANSGQRRGAESIGSDGDIIREMRSQEAAPA